MESKDKFCVILSTFPNENSAERLAQMLLEEQMAACISMLPGVRSLYLGPEEELQSEKEVLMLIKTQLDWYDDIEDLMLKHHPYETPELIILPINGGLGDYLAWVGDSTTIRR